MGLLALFFLLVFSTSTPTNVYDEDDIVTGDKRLWTILCLQFVWFFAYGVFFQFLLLLWFWWMKRERDMMGVSVRLYWWKPPSTVQTGYTTHEHMHSWAIWDLTLITVRFLVHVSIGVRCSVCSFLWIFCVANNMVVWWNFWINNDKQLFIFSMSLFIFRSQDLPSVFYMQFRFSPLFRPEHLFKSVTLTTIFDTHWRLNKW